MSETKFSSFQLRVLPGEALIYCNSTFTPCKTCALCVDVKEAPISPQIVGEWFQRTLKSLVGDDAAEIVSELLEKNPRQKDAFLKAVIKSRRKLR